MLRASGETWGGDEIIGVRVTFFMAVSFHINFTMTPIILVSRINFTRTPIICFFPH